MVLTGKEIIKQVELGNIHIDNFQPSKVNPNSYNLHLHDEMLTYTTDSLDMKASNPVQTIKIPSTGLMLYPNQLYLGRTVEYTKTDCFVPRIEGRSSIGRLGIQVHLTAGWGDIGFENYWTLEIIVAKPIIVYPFVEICQITYTTPQGDTSVKYHGKYQGTKNIDASKLFTELNDKS